MKWTNSVVTLHELAPISLLGCSLLKCSLILGILPFAERQLSVMCLPLDLHDKYRFMKSSAAS